MTLKTWHKTCQENPCQLSTYLNKFVQLIPKLLPESQKNSPTDFTRSRKLPLPKLLTFLLSLSASGKTQGVDGKSGEFFKQARRSGLWPKAEAVHRSAVTKARKKLSWTLFDNLMTDAVQLAYDIWPNSSDYTWHGMTVVAFDGSKYRLPATAEIREEFDPESGLQFPGKGHYPQCLVSTAFDVFRRLPIARTISPIHEGNEREDVKTLLHRLPKQSQVLLFDRGYPSYDLIHHLTHAQTSHYFLFRCPATSTFKAVENFVQSGQQEADIWLDTASHIKGRPASIKQQQAIQLRVLRLESPDGTLSILITNLLNRALYSSESITNLYFRRWKIEEQYREEKTYLDIETFHSRSENGIRQELLAVLIMCVISRTMMALMTENSPEKKHTPQFKNAIISLAMDAALLTSEAPEVALRIFRELLIEIRRVKYYQPKKTRKPYTRVSRKPINKWQQDKSQRIANA